MKRPSFSILCLLALLLLLGCSGGEEQRRQLEALEQQNRSGEQMLNDSLAESLVEYFDKHGDANERMRAKYILGRTYYCLGELPRALETYFEAADCADTTLTDCNYLIKDNVVKNFTKPSGGINRLFNLNNINTVIKENNTISSCTGYSQYW